MNFEEIAERTLEYEGGDKFVDHPADPGGATRWGITRSTLSAHRGMKVTKEDVRTLEKDEALTIYRAGYWDTTRCSDLPPPLALMVFDTAVTHGPGRAVRLLQLALGVTADGAFGPVTMRAARRAGEAQRRDFAVHRLLYWQSRHHWDSFKMGWSRRAIDILIEAERLAQTPVAE